MIPSFWSLWKERNNRRFDGISTFWSLKAKCLVSLFSWHFLCLMNSVDNIWTLLVPFLQYSRVVGFPFGCFSCFTGFCQASSIYFCLEQLLLHKCAFVSLHLLDAFLTSFNYLIKLVRPLLHMLLHINVKAGRNWVLLRTNSKKKHHGLLFNTTTFILVIRKEIIQPQLRDQNPLTSLGPIGSNTNYFSTL